MYVEISKEPNCNAQHFMGKQTRNSKMLKLADHFFIFLFFYFFFYTISICYIRSVHRRNIIKRETLTINIYNLKFPIRSCPLHCTIRDYLHIYMGLGRIFDPRSL